MRKFLETTTGLWVDAERIEAIGTADSRGIVIWLSGASMAVDCEGFRLPHFKTPDELLAHLDDWDEV